MRCYAAGGGGGNVDWRACVYADGWQLGEHGAWRKFTNFECATRVPLIISAPWIPPAQRQHRTNALVELVDLAPTIAELAGIPLPAGETFDGTSMVPLLSVPSSASSPSGAAAAAAGAGWAKDAAFSQYPKKVRATGPEWTHNGIIHEQRESFTHMGVSIRVDDWRLTQWVLWNQSGLRPLWQLANGSSGVVATELYDHRETRDYPTDFNQDENVNVANLTEHAALIGSLSTRLRQQFKG
jgi:iduronate 2-sulfatase